MDPKKSPRPEQEESESGSDREALVSELKAKDEEIRGLFDQLLRLKAEFENFRKRVDRERPGWVHQGKRELLGRLLSLYDVLLSAHGEIVHRQKEWGQAGELVRGLELIFKEFTRLFESEGVVVIETVGKPYDFHQHEVLGQLETDQFPEDTVIEEIQRGYTLNGNILRPAKVRVAKARGKA